MTWLAYEMARHPQLQARLHAEVDAMFDAIGDRDMTFADCKRMPFLTQCVMETLRKWTAVPNGTFRAPVATIGKLRRRDALFSPNPIVGQARCSGANQIAGFAPHQASCGEGTQELISSAWPGPI